MRSLFIISLLCLFLAPPSYAVNKDGKKYTKQINKETKLEKKLAKLTKRLDRKNANSETIVGQPRPWLSILMAAGSLGLLFLGVVASFGGSAVVAGIGFIGGFLLAILGVAVSFDTFRIRKESNQPGLTAFLSLQSQLLV